MFRVSCSSRILYWIVWYSQMKPASVSEFPKFWCVDRSHIYMQLYWILFWLFFWNSLDKRTRQKKKTRNVNVNLSIDVWRHINNKLFINFHRFNGIFFYTEFNISNDGMKCPLCCSFVRTSFAFENEWNKATGRTVLFSWRQTEYGYVQHARENAWNT